MVSNKSYLHLPSCICKQWFVLLGGNRDEAIRKRVAGEDDLTKQYLGKMKKMVCIIARLNCLTLICRYNCTILFLYFVEHGAGTSGGSF